MGEVPENHLKLHQCSVYVYLGFSGESFNGFYQAHKS